MTNEELKIKFAGLLPVISFEEGGEWLNMFVTPEEFKSFVKQLRVTPGLDFDYLFCESGVDWKEFMLVVYHLTSRKHKHTLVLKAKITDRVDPKIESVSDIWKTAEMQELEIFDLFGIKFINHPNLRRLFLDDTWGFPLRKDYVDETNIVAL